jgi:hypothetical protein
VFLARLAHIIRAAGEHASFILSSTWRLPQHRARVKKLEAAISEHLGRAFTFDDRTDLFPDHTPQERLGAIGKYVTEYATRNSGMIDQLKVLVLEDFHISPLAGLGSLNGYEMDSIEAIEKYLRERVECARTQAETQVRFVHTYDEWTTPEGLSVQLGCGLTMGNFCKAMSFMGGCCEVCALHRQEKVAIALQPAEAQGSSEYAKKAEGAKYTEEFAYDNKGVHAAEFADVVTAEFGGQALINMDEDVQCKRGVIPCGLATVVKALAAGFAPQRSRVQL